MHIPGSFWLVERLKCNKMFGCNVGQPVPLPTSGPLQPLLLLADGVSATQTPVEKALYQYA